MFGDGLPSPPASPWQAACELVELGALTEDEIDVLKVAAQGDVEAIAWLGCSVEQAAGLLQRWSGPIPGLKLAPLPHWRNNLRAVH
ncbi:MAG: hypothetical protein DLM56_00440 [Pseudonocardiales bacterium]|nr:MAG: hypothetical protein DLM56_00440 [Pseudonocardiales bacterium]